MLIPVDWKPQFQDVWLVQDAGCWDCRLRPDSIHAKIPSQEIGASRSMDSSWLNVAGTRTHRSDSSVFESDGKSQVDSTAFSSVARGWTHLDVLRNHDINHHKGGSSSETQSRSTDPNNTLKRVDDTFTVHTTPLRQEGKRFFIRALSTAKRLRSQASRGDRFCSNLSRKIGNSQL